MHTVVKKERRHDKGFFVTLLSLVEKDLFSVELVGGLAVRIEGGRLTGNGTLTSTCFWHGNLKREVRLITMLKRMKRTKAVSFFAS